MRKVMCFLVIVMLAVGSLGFTGCASSPDGEQQQMSPESQKAIVRIIARNAGRAVCMVKPEVAPEVALVSGLLSGSNPTLAMFERWTGVLSSMVGLDEDIKDLMIILQEEGMLDPQFNSTANEVLPWVQECAKAMYQGVGMCVPVIQTGG